MTIYSKACHGNMYNIVAHDNVIYINIANAYSYIHVESTWGRFMQMNYQCSTRYLRILDMIDDYIQSMETCTT